jgi:hypothetical protein
VSPVDADVVLVAEHRDGKIDRLEAGHPQKPLAFEAMI